MVIGLFQKYLSCVKQTIWSPWVLPVPSGVHYETYSCPVSSASFQILRSQTDTHTERETDTIKHLHGKCIQLVSLTIGLIACAMSLQLTALSEYHVQQLVNSQRNVHAVALVYAQNVSTTCF